MRSSSHFIWWMPGSPPKRQEVGELLLAGQLRFLRIGRGKIQVFLKVQRIYPYLHIASGQQRGQLTGKQLRV